MPIRFPSSTGRPRWAASPAAARRLWPPRKLPTSRASWMDRITLHGHELCYVDVGSGAPIVFVHGLMSSSSTWSAQIDRHATDHRVIAPDLYGHGQSAKPAGDYSLSAHAASLRDLFDALGVVDATLVGHS